MSQHISSRSPSVSIIIPARNEARRLPLSLDQIAGSLSDRIELAEIIVVDNGSTDGTGEVVRRFAQSHPSLSMRLVTEPMPGKGAAVRTGMLLGAGDLLFQCDADLSMPIAELEKLVDAIETGGDLAIGCREGNGANRHGESLLRRLMGRVFNTLVQTMELSGLPDTQCGFKLFRRDVARDLFSSQTITGWGFDVEILVLASQHGYSVASVPINWKHDSDSRVRPIRDGLVMMQEIWSIRQHWITGSYGPSFDSCSRSRIQKVLESAANCRIEKFGGSLSLRRIA